MKTATIPSLRVAPEFRQAAESVLHDGETLSGFVEQSLRANIERRRFQQEFVTRGLAARAQARLSGEYYPAEEVQRELEELLTQAEAKAGA